MCVTVNKLKCRGIQRMSGALSNVAPMCQAAFDVLAGDASHSKSAVRKLATTGCSTHLKVGRVFVNARKPWTGNLFVFAASPPDPSLKNSLATAGLAAHRHPNAVFFPRPATSVL